MLLKLRKCKTLIKVQVLLIVFLFFNTIIGYAEYLVDEKLLKEYVSKGFNGGHLEQRNTLLKFQAENNLLVDGVIGKETSRALKEEDRKVIDTIPKAVKKDKWFIVINKTKKILTVYKEGEIYIKYPVAVGKPSSPTPDYKFTIVNKAKDPYWGGMGGKSTPVKGGAPNNPLGRRWLGLSTDKHWGYGIHGNSSPSSIGGYVSSGCIRMINEDVGELFEYIPVETKVWVGTEDILEKWGVSQRIQFKEKKPRIRIRIGVFKCISYSETMEYFEGRRHII